MRQLSIWFLTLILACSATAALGQSQLGTGAISGSVTDTNGAAIVGAAVKVTNTGTGLVRNANTNSAGQFNVPVLPAGTYSVTVEQSGFSKLEQSNLDVTVGRAINLSLELKPGAIGEIINVTAEVTIDTTKTEETSLINRNQINDLPINGRRADQFALLIPGVTRDGRFGLLSYRGQSGVFNNFTIEGNDDNQALFSEARGRTRIASNISANAIQEFQVEQSNFLPEFGRSAGGGINATIRSGANTLHGDGFYYFRNQLFNARDPLSTIRPDEKRQQFGGSVSGPILKDRLFYFVNYDQQVRNYPLVIQDLNGNLSKFASTDLDFLAGCNDVIKRIQALPGASANQNLVCGNADPALKNQFLALQPRTGNQELFLTKIDATLNAKNALSVTYNYLNAHALDGIQTPIVLGNIGRNGSDDVRIHSLNTRLTTTLTPSLINEFRFQWGRDFEFEFTDQSGPQVSLTGGFSFGTATFLERPAFPDERRYQFVDNLSYTIGKHALKFGGEVNKAKDILNNPALFAGQYNYSDLKTYGHDLTHPGDRSYTSFNQSFGQPAITFSTIDYAAYLQDQFKISRRLTINYGLRYDYQQLPSPIAPNPAFPETQTFNKDRTDFGPRFGAAYDIGGNGRTVIRGGWGLYYARTPNGQIQNALQQTGILDPTTAIIAINVQPPKTPDPTSVAPVFPALIPALPTAVAGSTSLSLLASDFKRPRLEEINVSVERELAKNLTLSASFIYTKGDRLPVSIDANLPTPTSANTFTRTFALPDGSTFTVPFLAGLTRNPGFDNTGKPNGSTVPLNNSRPRTNFGSISETSSTGETYYKALFVEVKRRFSKGVQFNVSYTLSKAENLSGTGDGAGTGSESPFGGSSMLDQFGDPKKNRAPASTDQRHRLVINGIYNLPHFDTDSRLVGGLINGFRISGIITAESGRPYSTGISVPSLAFQLPDGSQYNGFGGLFGQGGSSLLPTVPRNNNVGDANYRLDLRLARDIRITERITTEVLFEGFNVFNRANFNGFNSTLYDATLPALPAGTPAGNLISVSTPIPLTARTNFGLPTADGSQPDGTNARRLQLSFRFRF